MLIFIFKVKTCFWHFIILANTSQMARDRANIIIGIRQEVMYLPSRGSNANVVRRELDKYSRSYNFGKSFDLFWKTVRTRKNAQVQLL